MNSLYDVTVDSFLGVAPVSTDLLFIAITLVIICEKCRVQFLIEIMFALDPNKTVSLTDDSRVNRAAHGFHFTQDLSLERGQIYKRFRDRSKIVFRQTVNHIYYGSYKSLPFQQIYSFV